MHRSAGHDHAAATADAVSPADAVYHNAGPPGRFQQAGAGLNVDRFLKRRENNSARRHVRFL
jgi:hypothetical protein